MTGYWMGIPCAAGELEKTCYRFLFSSLLSPAVWCVVTGTQLYHLTIIHFLPAVTHLTSCLVWILFISRDRNWSWFQTRPYRIQFWWRLFQFHSLNWFKACLKFNPPVIDRAKSGVMPALVNFPLSRPILSSDSVSWEADQWPAPCHCRHRDNAVCLFRDSHRIRFSCRVSGCRDATECENGEKLCGTEGGINSKLGGCSDNSLSPHLLVTKSMVHPLKSPSPLRQDV